MKIKKWKCNWCYCESEFPMSEIILPQKHFYMYDEFEERCEIKLHHFHLCSHCLENLADILKLGQEYDKKSYELP